MGGQSYPGIIANLAQGRVPLPNASHFNLRRTLCRALLNQNTHRRKRPSLQDDMVHSSHVSRTEVLLAFSEFAASHGLIEPRGGFAADGKRHRCGVTGGKKRNSDGAYGLHVDGVPAGWVQNWKNGDGAAKWCFYKNPTPEQRAALAQQAKISAKQQAEEEARRRKKAAAEARQEWDVALPALGNEPYLARKGIQPHGLKVDAEGRLLVPLRDAAGVIHSLQRIAPDGSKRFLAGGRKEGLFHAIGALDAKGEILIGEGFATMASAHEATGRPAVVAFDCGNLLPAAKELRKKYRRAKLVFCADDDHRTEGNPGITKAREAAAAVGGRVAVPVFAGERGEKDTDFNDLAVKEGLHAVRRCILADDPVPADETQPEQKPEAAKHRDESQKPEPASSDGYAPKYSEEWLALGFAHKYRRKLRYVKKWGAWMEWDGKRWAQEDTLLAYDLIRKECRAAAALADNEAENYSTIGDLSKAKTRSAVEILARSDRRFAATAEQWDADDWLINTPDGIIDLRTGKNIGRDPGKYCTKITDHAPGGDCLLWRRFLAKVTNGDEELQAYIQRMCGYWLTGSIREHALFFIYGPGGNGKGVFLNTVSAVMGMYHVVSPAQTFAEQKNQRHETELARLNGARLVVSQETEQGQYWAEARIKSLTGGDKIAARFMRGDFFEFDPKFKLCIVGNHKPQLRAVDDAIRRRFNLIPFDVKISADEKDPDLSDKLKAEYGGILAWMVAGCIEWQREGLNPPEKVLAATNEYLDSEDTIGLWLSDMCITPESYRGDEIRRKAANVRTVGAAQTALLALFKSWKDYAEASNFPCKNNKFLGEQLANRGFKKGRDKRGAFFKGLRLKTQEERVLDGVDGEPVTHGDGDSLSTVYARTDTRTRTYMRDTAEMGGASPCVTNGEALEVAI